MLSVELCPQPPPKHTQKKGQRTPSRQGRTVGVAHCRGLAQAPQKGCQGRVLTRIILLKLHDVPPLLERRFITPGTRAGRMSGSVHTSASALPVVGSDDLHPRGMALKVKVAVGQVPRLEVPLSALPALPGTCSSRTRARMLNGSGSGSRVSRSARLCRVAWVPLLSIVITAGANGRSLLAGKRLSLHHTRKEDGADSDDALLSTLRRQETTATKRGGARQRDKPL